MADKAGKRLIFGGADITDSKKVFQDPSAFKIEKSPDWLKKRNEVFDRLIEKQNVRLAKEEKRPIKVTMPDGWVKEGMRFETSPLDIANGISKGLGKAAVVAKVFYLEKIASLNEIGQTDWTEADDSDAEEEEAAEEEFVLWDMSRPLEGNCKLEFLKFDSTIGKMVAWHSSAHILGQWLETEFGGYLTIGPPLENGFYYDMFVGQKKISQETDLPMLEKVCEKIAKEDQKFERLVLTKEEALEIFQDNPFKVQLITDKVPDGTKTSCYRNGPLIDLCRGPHLPSTSKAGAFWLNKNSSCYWLGKTDNDTLQRIYGVSFPDSKQLKEHKKFIEEAKKRDHRIIGKDQELYFFQADYSAGSCFWMPHGARLYNKLIDFMRAEYSIRGFHEVITPNMYNSVLFKTSGHYFKYKDGMYGLDIEGEDWYMKPMNCPGHCVMFSHRTRSYKELPFRMADFGVLHRNELSGSLSGLTRVRRFQQDDAHIFCRPDQIKGEIVKALDFVNYVYKVFGLKYSLVLSTRPKLRVGSNEQWDVAEQQLAEALNEFCGKSGFQWSLNKGDGAFYGPKIDMRIMDALERKHQCATIQLDFQNPMRFNLQYQTEASANEEAEKAANEAAAAAEAGDDDAKPMTWEEKRAAKKERKAAKNAAESAEAGDKSKKSAEVEVDADKLEKSKSSEEKLKSIARHQTMTMPPNTSAVVAHDADKESEERLEKRGIEGKLKTGFERPVMIHRAILGSVERFTGILCEHYAGKWPFFISPRQIMVIPSHAGINDYCNYVKDQMTNFGFYCESDLGTNTLNKKIRNAQLAQYNYMLIVGDREKESLMVTIRSRDEAKQVEMPLWEAITKFKAENWPISQELYTLRSFEGRMPKGAMSMGGGSSGGSASSAGAGGAGVPPPKKIEDAPSAEKKGEKKASVKEAAPAAAAAAAAPAKGSSKYDETYFGQFPYCGGFSVNEEDVKLFNQYVQDGSAPKGPNVQRWFAHIGKLQEQNAI